MERIRVTTVFVAIVALLEYKGLKTEDTPKACDVNQKCSCCVSEDDCLASHIACGECLGNFFNYTCLGPCDKYMCSGSICVGGYCQIPCKDGYWGTRCIKKCPDNCVSCHQEYRKTNECFKCVAGKYGMNCSDSCSINCADKTCDKKTGSCLNCNQGYYDQVCSDECPVNCANNSCEKLTGLCYNCKPGYFGHICSVQCPKNCGTCEKTYGTCLSCKQGYYGKSCSEKCPYTCGNDTCNMATGTCFSCEKGYYGTSCSKNCPTYCRQGCNFISGYCDSCTNGYHGNACEMKCPSNCISNVCLQDNGTCSEGCKQNFEGDMCTTCKPGKYGEDCSQTCSPGCKNDVCDRGQGNCTIGCKFGFSDFQFCCTNNLYCAACVRSSSCKICMESKYGSQCELGCPVNCNDTCDMLSGNCTSCLVGFYGNECDNECNKLCRYSICDIKDGQCSFGCINNSTKEDCLGGLSQIIPGGGGSVTTGVLVGMGVIVLIVMGVLSTYFIRKWSLKRSNGDIVAPTYDSLQGNLRNTDSAYSSYAPQRCSDDASEHVYINTA